MAQKSNQMMTQSWKNEKEGQGDSLVSPSGISMIWKVNLKEDGFFSLVFFFTPVSEDRSIAGPQFVTQVRKRIRYQNDCSGKCGHAFAVIIFFSFLPFRKAHSLAK